MRHRQHPQQTNSGGRYVPITESCDASPSSGTLAELTHDQCVARLNAKRLGRIAFEVDEAKESAGTGWSVIVYGTIEQTWRPEEQHDIRALGLFSWAPERRDRILRIFPTRITGRQIIIDSDT
jgi:hypothetical protein